MKPLFQHALTPLESGVTVIAASAGTGKTFTLAALVIRLIAEHGIPIHRLLLTTYTVAATAELRERIRARLINTLDALRSGETEDEFLKALLPGLPAEAAERLRAAIRDFDEANIQTIHGFCQRALQEHAFETNASFNAEIIADAVPLFTEIADDYWRRNVYTASPLLAAVIAHCKLQPSDLLTVLKTLGTRGGLTILPSANEFQCGTEALEHLLEEFREAWQAWHEPLRRFLVHGNTWGNKHYHAEDLEPLVRDLDAASAPGADCLALLRACKAFCRLTSKQVWDGTNKRKHKVPLNHPLFDLCDRFTAAIDGVRDTFLAHFLAWARTALDRRKAEKGVLLFDDLLTRLHDALNGSGGESATAQLGKRYDAVLVDEFQDTDPVQAEIFLRLFGTERHRLFLIGDPKQAIYGFRGADLFAYLKAVETSQRHYTLRQNQRSATNLVAAVNTLFERPRQPFLDARIPFEAVDAAGRADRTRLEAGGRTRPAFHFWYWKSQERLSASFAGMRLPEMVAAEITRLLSGGATLGGVPVQPGDCAVLCRDNWQARAMVQALAMQNVPAVVMSNANVFESQEAYDLRLILASLAEPAREPLLRSALTCAALGYTMANLLEIEGTLAAWEDVRQRWHAHHGRWRDMGFIRMFREFIRAEKVPQHLLALQDGERRLTNLQHLAELLHSAAESQHLGTTGLIHWLEQQIAGGNATAESELRLDRDDSAVRVVTIHKSKGLEFPIVFCPYLWRDAGLRENGPLLFHDEESELVCDLRIERDPLHEARAADEQLAEEIRLLYVALTRAKYECHIVWGPFGTARRPESSALLRLLEPPTGDPTFAALETHAGNCPPEKLEQTVSEICEANPELFALHVLPGGPAPRLVSLTESFAPLTARSFHRAIDSTWRSMSYSALTATIDAELDGEYSDRRMIDPTLLMGIHAFPRGMKPGSCLHNLLEQIDYTAGPEDLQSFLERKLREHAMFSPENVTALIAMIAEIRHVIPRGALERGSHIRELEFHLPAAMLSPAELEHFAGGELKFDRQRGILKGYIDVVFQHEERFYILDWKSNWLGATTESYMREAMDAEMLRYRYGLQRQIYLFALHRYLQGRMPNYSPEMHLGGAYYIFLRGLDHKYPERGIIRTNPDVQSLIRMERLFPKP